MRKPELMLDLLEEMSKDPMGRLVIPMMMGMSDREQEHYHHVELLVDAGHAEWTGSERSVARITNAGYDFLNATSNPASGQTATSNFIELFNGGVSYARATQSAMDFVAKAMGA